MSGDEPENERRPRPSAPGQAPARALTTLFDEDACDTGEESTPEDESMRVSVALGFSDGTMFTPPADERTSYEKVAELLTDSARTPS